MMFDQTGQAVVLMSIPGLHTALPPVQPQPRVRHHAARVVGTSHTNTPAQGVYVPCDLVIKQEPTEHDFGNQVCKQRNQDSLHHSSFGVSPSSQNGLTVKQEPGLSLPVSVPVNGLVPSLSLNVTDTLHHGFCGEPLFGQNGMTVKQEQGLSPPVSVPVNVQSLRLNVVDTEPDPLTMGLLQCGSGTDVMVNSHSEPVNGLPSRVDEYSVMQESLVTPPREMTSPLSETSQALSEPDTTALTTLAIVCDNIGSGKERQYVVKVELEENVNIPAVPAKSSEMPPKHSVTSDNQDVRHKKKTKSSVSVPPVLDTSSKTPPKRSVMSDNQAVRQKKKTTSSTSVTAVPATSSETPPKRSMTSANQDVRRKKKTASSVSVPVVPAISSEMPPKRSMTSDNQAFRHKKKTESSLSVHKVPATSSEMLPKRSMTSDNQDVRHKKKTVSSVSISVVPAKSSETPPKRSMTSDNQDVRHKKKTVSSVSISVVPAKSSEMPPKLSMTSDNQALRHKKKTTSPVSFPVVPAISSETPPKCSTTSDNQNVHHKKKTIPSVSAQMQELEPGTCTVKRSQPKNQRTKRKMPSVDLTEMCPGEESIKSSLAPVNSLAPGESSPKKSRAEKSKISNGKKTGKRERSKASEVVPSKRVRKHESRSKMSADHQSRTQPSPDLTPSLPQDEIHVKTESVGELSPASTIAYGEDSNDSVDISSPSMFRCLQCSKSYTSDRRLRLHIGLVHEESDKNPLSSIYSCSQCTKAYANQKRLDLHTQLVHEHRRSAPNNEDNQSTRNKRKSSHDHLLKKRKRRDRKKRSSSESGGQEEVESDTVKGVKNRVVENTDDSTSHACTMCKKQYASKNHLYLHIGLCHTEVSTRNRHKKHREEEEEEDEEQDEDQDEDQEEEQQTVSTEDISDNVGIKLEALSDCETDVLPGVEIQTEAEDTEHAAQTGPRTRHQCAQCGLIFMEMEHYDYHLPVHEGEKIHLKYKFQKKKNRRVVIERYYMHFSDDKERPYQCLLCERTFGERRTFTNHVNNVHEIYDSEDRIFACNQCGKQFTKRGLLQRHLLTHMSLEDKVERNKKVFTCTECGRNFNQKVHLERHHHFMHTDAKFTRAFKCTICERSFKLKAHLDRHVKLHSGSLPYKCRQCPVMCADRHALRCHMRCHTGERPYPCLLCEKRFALKTSLFHHTVDFHPQTLSEAERLRHKCTVCGKILNQSYLRIHMAMHRKEWRHQCDVCGRGFMMPCQLKFHYRTVHEGKRPYQCAKCPRGFKSKYCLKIHLAKKHK